MEAGPGETIEVIDTHRFKRLVISQSWGTRFLITLCCLLVAHVAHAMTLSVQQISLAGGETVKALQLQGTIDDDDGKKLTEFLGSWTPEERQTILWVVLDSEGGSVREALRIARSLRQWGFVSHTPRSAKCISACVFLYAAGLVRIPAVEEDQVNLTRNIGLHRAFIGRSYLKTLRMSEAAQLTRSIQQIVERAFIEFDLPPSLYQTAMATASTDVRWLDETDMQSIATYPAWFEEFVLAKCEALETISKTKPLDVYTRIKSACAVELIKAHRSSSGWLHP